EDGGNFTAVVNLTDEIVTTKGINKENTGDGYILDKSGNIYEYDYDAGEFKCLNTQQGSALYGKKVKKIIAEDHGYSNCIDIIIDSDGKVYTKGGGEYGTSGDNINSGAHEDFVCISDLPGNALNDKKIVDIFYGYSYVMVKDEEGKLYTWGKNYRGRLGDGTITGEGDIRRAPICISDIEGSALKGVKITEIYSLNSVIAKDSEGKLYTWGDNIWGLLGDGTRTNRYTPICISDQEGALKNKKIVNIDFIGYNTVIAKDSDGKLYAWGGDNDEEYIPICISDQEESALKGVKITETYCGSQYYVFAKDVDGKLYTWGDYRDVLLDNGTTISRRMPICISDQEGSVLKNKKIVDVYFGNNDNYVIKDSEGKLYTWGSNLCGQLGDGTTTDRDTPICISDIEGSALKNKKIADIYFGSWSHHMMVRDEEGKLYTWGDNSYRQLGDGT
ncbi:MAG: hypothetical protein HUJ68_03330, partial [Clostridia bacterium]|nr:hypothetical protein [Clostridia bacterium]